MAMRGVTVVLAVSAACGSSAHPASDAGADAATDAPGCQPQLLLTGGPDVVPQGWSTVMQPPATLTYGADYAELQTTTPGGARTGGQLLLSHPAAIDAGQPFAIQIVLQVESVSPHNQLDAGAAILGSFTPPFGAGGDRDQMIYLDAAKIGWADDTQSFATSVTDGAYHTYELSVDAAGIAHVRVDGIAALTRSGFTTNGTIAIGDQTNDPNVDGAIRIRSVTRLCP
jgi:hypothetical protein